MPSSFPAGFFVVLKLILYQGMRTLEKLGVHNALTDENGYRGPSGIPQIVRYDCGYQKKAYGY